MMIIAQRIEAGDTPTGQFPLTPFSQLDREYDGNGAAFAVLPSIANDPGSGQGFVWDWWNYGSTARRAPSTAAGIKYSYLNPTIYVAEAGDSLTMSGTERGLWVTGSQLNNPYEGIIVGLGNGESHHIRVSGNPYSGGSEVYGVFAISPQDSNELIFGVTRLGGDFAYDIIVYPARIVSMQKDNSGGGASEIIRSVTEDNFIA